MEQPPPRFGDWSSANRHLTAGGTVEGIPRENPYREYYLALHKKNMEKELKFLGSLYGANLYVKTDSDVVFKRTADWLEEARQSMMNVDPDTLCGKPHNNGRETCEECEVIKKGV